MKLFKLVSILFIALSGVFGATVSVANSGWSLLGALESISPSALFNSQTVNIVWAWDATNKKWIAYTPTTSASYNGITTLQANGTVSSFDTSGQISAGSGYWINTTMANNIYTNTPTNPIFDNFGVGFGGSSSFRFNDANSNAVYVNVSDLMINENIETNNYYKTIKNFNSSQFDLLQKYLQKSKYFVIWVTKGWQSSWYSVSDINKVVAQGKTPIFMYWYFGDTLVNGMPTQSAIDTYYTDAQRFGELIKSVNGEKLVILEPEFNKQSVLNNVDSFATIISNSIDYIKAKDTKALFSLCMTDTGNRGVNATYSSCGYDNCSLGDKGEWSKSKPIYDALINKLDFVSFQEMLGQFSRNPSTPGGWTTPNPIAYTDAQLGIINLHTRIENFSKYLYDTYKKPVFLPYIAVATASWNDTNANKVIDEMEIDKAGWETQANSFYVNLDNTKLQQNKMFGYAVMSLFDDPGHDKGGYQYFINNEYHLGIVKSSAVDGVDKGANGDIEFKKEILNSVFK